MRYLLEEINEAGEEVVVTGFDTLGVLQHCIPERPAVEQRLQHGVEVARVAVLQQFVRCSRGSRCWAKEAPRILTQIRRVEISSLPCGWYGRQAHGDGMGPWQQRGGASGVCFRAHQRLFPFAP